MIRSSSAGTAGFRRTGGVGVPCRIASNTIAGVFPANA
jgi:hypothetical protein